MSTARAFGMRQFRYALVPEVLTALAPCEIEHAVTDVIGQIVEVLTTDPKENSGKGLAKVKPVECLI